MAGNTNNRFKRNAEASGVEPKAVKPEVEENETVNAAEAAAETPAVPQATETSAPAPAAPAPVEESASGQDNSMTVALNGMIDFEHRFKKREPKNKQIPLNITPTMNEQLMFLAEKNMIKSRNDFIFQLVESALNNIFSNNQEIRDAFNQTRKWEK